MHAVAVQALATLMDGDDHLVVAIQNIAEFWNTVTRPEANNGLGYTADEASTELAKLEQFFGVVHESAASFDAWKALVRTHGVRGVQVHGARLASVMMAEGIRRILTFNDRDFARYQGIEAVHPGIAGRLGS
jgi:predicted nucleic acid-binding protein